MAVRESEAAEGCAQFGLSARRLAFAEVTLVPLADVSCPWSLWSLGWASVLSPEPLLNETS
jgi:hypothetical protein